MSRNTNVLLFLSLIALLGCGSDKKEKTSQEMEEICRDHFTSLNIKQRLDALLIVANNDTVKVLYSLSMPKQVFKRLSKGSTAPTEHTNNMTSELYVKSVLTHAQYMDSLYEDMQQQIEKANKDKDDLHKVNWLINNSFNEPIQPVWEKIIINNDQ